MLRHVLLQLCTCVNGMPICWGFITCTWEFTTARSSHHSFSPALLSSSCSSFQGHAKTHWSYKLFEFNNIYEFVPQNCHKWFKFSTLLAHPFFWFVACNHNSNTCSELRGCIPKHNCLSTHLFLWWRRIGYGIFMQSHLYLATHLLNVQTLTQHLPKF